MTPAERGRLDGDEHWECIREEKSELIEQLQEEDQDEGGVPGGEQGYKAAQSGPSLQERGRMGAAARWGKDSGKSGGGGGGERRLQQAPPPGRRPKDGPE